MALNDSFGAKSAPYIETDKDIVIKDNKEGFNEIFNSIPIEKEKEENSSKEYYNYLYLKEKLSFNLNNIFNIMNKKLNNKRMKLFYTLKQKSNIKYSKLVEAQILYLLIETNFKSLSHFFQKKRLDIFHFTITKIKNYISSNKYYKEYDSKKNDEVKKNINEMDENLKKIEKKFKEKSEEIDNLKKKLTIQKKEMEGIKVKNNNLEERYNQLIGKNNELKEIISLSRQKSAKYNYEIDPNEEKKILELQNKIKIKEKENEKQLAYFELFYQNMNDILSHYESKYDTIKSTINTTNQNI
jgi:hypothetical protein